MAERVRETPARLLSCLCFALLCFSNTGFVLFCFVFLQTKDLCQPCIVREQNFLAIKYIYNAKTYSIDECKHVLHAQGNQKVCVTCFSEYSLYCESETKPMVSPSYMPIYTSIYSYTPPLDKSKHTLSIKETPIFLKVYLLLYTGFLEVSHPVWCPNLGLLPMTSCR